MGKYILGAHQIIVEKRVSAQQTIIVQQLKQFYHQTQIISETDDLDAQILKNHFNKTVIIEALISLIVVRNLAYAIIE